MKRVSVLLAAVMTCAALLWPFAPSPAAALRQVLDVDSSIDPTAPVVAALTLVAQGLSLWLLVATLATLAARLPGLAGTLGAALARGCVPTAVRRALEVALGFSVTVGALGSTPALAAGATVHLAAVGGPAPASPAVPVPDLDWPLAPAGPASPPLPPRGPLPSTGPLPSAQPPASPAPAATPASSDVPPAVATVVAAPPPAAPPAAPASAAPVPTPVDAVVVRPGDTLWALAATALERSRSRPPTSAAVAREWPRWWAANREAIGDDPDLILPGTSLTPPPPSAP